MLPYTSEDQMSLRSSMAFCLPIIIANPVLTPFFLAWFRFLLYASKLKHLYCASGISTSSLWVLERDVLSLCHSKDNTENTPRGKNLNSGTNDCSVPQSLSEEKKHLSRSIDWSCLEAVSAQRVLWLATVNHLELCGPYSGLPWYPGMLPTKKHLLKGTRSQYFNPQIWRYWVEENNDLFSILGSSLELKNYYGILNSGDLCVWSPCLIRGSLIPHSSKEMSLMHKPLMQ